MIEWQHFHFVRPEWLLLIPLSALALLLHRRYLQPKLTNNKVIASHLLPQLIVGEGGKSSIVHHTIHWWFIAATLAALALAGPAWNKLPQPVYQANLGRVMLIDMSLSMRATDLSPNRLTRARFKAIDLVSALKEGEMGLVAYAGDAFTISPLTEDGKNITTLLPSLSPEIMPLPGSEPLTGLQQASELLSNAGYSRGQIYWITDGISANQISELNAFIAESSFDVNVLAVGTEQGAPIRLPTGEFLKDNRGAIVIPTLRIDQLRQAVGNRGRVIAISQNNDDIQRLVTTADALSMTNQQPQQSERQGDVFEDMGGYLAWLLLPLALAMFQRSKLLCLGLLTLPLLQPPIALAQTEPGAPNSLGRWFKNTDQQGLEAYRKHDYTTAVEQFNDPFWQASAAYKAGDYERALAQFSKLDGLDATYNRANAQAQLGQLEAALASYEQVLAEAPNHAEAQHNKKLIERLLQQQNQQNSDQQPQQGEQSSNDNQQSNQGENGKQDASSSSQAPPSQNSSSQDPSQQNPSAAEENNQQPGSSSTAPQRGEQASADESVSENAANQQQSANAEQSTSSDSSNQTSEQPSGVVQARDLSQLSAAEREQLQRMNTLLNRVPDDPAYLLQQKMLLEAKRRRAERYRQPKGSQW